MDEFWSSHEKPSSFLQAHPSFSSKTTCPTNVRRTYRWDPQMLHMCSLELRSLNPWWLMRFLSPLLYILGDKQKQLIMILSSTMTTMINFIISSTAINLSTMEGYYLKFEWGFPNEQMKKQPVARKNWRICEEAKDRDESSGISHSFFLAFCSHLK